VVSNLLAADGIFITGGDQSRLMTELWETASFRAIHQVFNLNGICVAGTSAGDHRVPQGGSQDKYYLQTSSKCDTRQEIAE